MKVKELISALKKVDGDFIVFNDLPPKGERVVCMEYSEGGEDFIIIK